MLDKVSILITTFWRPGYLRHCLNGIHANLPECEVCVACDDDSFNSAPTSDRWKFLPFDSGLTPKRNAAVSLATREYALLGCDDFDFSTLEARLGVERMVSVLNAWPDVDVVVGTYNDKKYEGMLEYVPGEYIREHRINTGTLVVAKIDIGVNYFLARTEFLRKFPWDEKIRPIGGEHGDWFMTLKQAGRTVVWVRDCNIRSFSYAGGAHPEYSKMRWRAQIGHEEMLKKWNIKRWIGFDEC